MGCMLVLIGCVVVIGLLSWVLVILFGVVFLWILLYYWLLLMCYKEDYVLVNVLMLVVVKGWIIVGL